MNYRHAFHAGNFADVMKHALLARMLVYLQRKETPIRVIDTHAGVGLYDLGSPEAERTGEWVDGIGRMEQPFSPEVETLLTPYREALARVRARHGERAYPGSPGLVRELLRKQDRGILVELHPADFAELEGRFNPVANLKTMHLDGWTALHALIPPKERRGLVLIDPPYEEPKELERLAGEIVAALARWPTGVYVGWYPVKDMAAVEAVASMLDEACPRPGLRLEVLVDDPREPARLNGSGLFVVNPPYTLKDEAERLLPELAKRLTRGAFAAYRCEPFGPAA